MDDDNDYDIVVMDDAMELGAAGVLLLMKFHMVAATKAEKDGKPRVEPPSFAVALVTLLAKMLEDHFDTPSEVLLAAVKANIEYMTEATTGTEMVDGVEVVSVDKKRDKH